MAAISHITNSCGAGRHALGIRGAPLPCGPETGPALWQREYRPHLISGKFRRVPDDDRPRVGEIGSRVCSVRSERGTRRSPHRRAGYA